MPAMPIALSSAPIVVGISATSSAISTVSDSSVPAKSANGRRVTTTARNTIVRPESRIDKAISFGVLRRAAPSTSAIMRSRNDCPGSWVISTTMWSESTRVPPVTALRSPPASRMTGADSPVIADSSTEAMPSITVPSPGMTSPASTTTTSPRCSSAAGFVAAVAQPRRGLGAHRAQRVGLGLAAALGDRLGEVAEQHGQPQPDRDREGEPARLVAADDPRDRDDHRADLDHEHDRVAQHQPRVELAEGGEDRPAQDRALEHQRGLQCGVELDDVHGPLTGEAEQRPARVVHDQVQQRSRGMPRSSATRLAWISALTSEMCGSTPDADVVTASGGMSPPAGRG